MNGCEKNSGESPSLDAVKTPDPDAIKMFVGQIPRSFDENDLMKIFGHYGPVYQLNILKDKTTNQSRGCCFVTYHHRKDAVAAQCAMHDIITLPGMHHPVQMKPADAENRNDRKLFVGMLNKSMTEQDVQNLFSPFGLMEDCAVLKDLQGQSRGCAFVTFASRQSALNAIKSLHHSQTMEGCSSPLVVKLADTQKDKELKKTNVASMVKAAPAGLSGLSLNQASATNPLLNLLQNVGLNSLNALTLQQQLALLTPSVTTSNIPNVSTNMPNILNSSLNTGINSNLMQNLPALTLLNSLSGTSGSSALNCGQQSLINGGNFSLSSLLLPKNTLLSGLSAIQQQQQSSQPIFANNAAAVGTASSTDICSPLGGMSQTLLNSLANANNSVDILSSIYGKLNQYTANLATFSNSTLQGHQGAGKQIEGPEGCNLFIYHLPQEFTDLDLIQTFQPFGNVLSARVFIDKQTNLSKCFGFVSYDNAVSSQSAIQAMNGFQIGTKRLKVQLKRSKNDNKPYSHNNIAVSN